MDSPPDRTDADRTVGQLLPRRGHVLAVLVLIGAVVFVIVTWRIAYERELRAAETEFVARTAQAADLLRQRMINYELLTRGGAALFASVKRPTPQQWNAYVEGMHIRDRFPDVVGFGFAGYVRGERVGDLQREWRDAGYGELRVHPDGPREFYGPILYLEPKSPENLQAIGFDMYSRPTRHDAMQLALETGQAQLSGPVRLIQDDLVQDDLVQDGLLQGGRLQEQGIQHDPAAGGSSLVLVLPVYRGGERPLSTGLRQQSMQGWVYVPFRMARFVSESLRGAYPNLRFSVYDLGGATPQRLYATNGSAVEGPPAFEHSIEIDHYGRRWRLHFRSAPLAIAAPELEGLRIMLGLGLFAALLMYAVVWSLAHVEARAHRIARRMTEDYRRSELRFRTALEYSAIGAALLDSEGCIVEANPALGAIVGKPPQSLVGLRFESLFEDDEEPAPTLQHPADADGVYRTTRRLHHSGGVPHHTQLTYAPVPGNLGQDIVELVQAEDVTERLRAQARVQALNRTLEARVALRTRELSLANQELEAFAYSVSHDLRAPLRAIDGFSRILAERYGDTLDDGGQGYLGRVRKAAARMGELIDALLKMSRVARSELRPGPVDLSRMAAEVVDDLAAGDRDRQVETVIAPGLQAQGDAVLLRNLLSNLLGNAWKFTRGRERPRIEFGSQPGADGERQFFVRDNGAGFSQEYVDKLFRPFQRLHGQEQFAGHGIGLASVKRIVERHGGRIRAEGREGEGATFYFTLPEPEGHSEGSTD